MVLLQRLEGAPCFDPCLWHPSPKHGLSHPIFRHPPSPFPTHYPYPAPHPPTLTSHDVTRWRSPPTPSSTS